MCTRPIPPKVQSCPLQNLRSDSSQPRDTTDFGTIPSTLKPCGVGPGGGCPLQISEGVNWCQACRAVTMPTHVLVLNPPTRL